MKLKYWIINFVCSIVGGILIRMLLINIGNKDFNIWSILMGIVIFILLTFLFLGVDELKNKKGAKA